MIEIQQVGGAQRSIFAPLPLLCPVFVPVLVFLTSRYTPVFELNMADINAIAKQFTDFYYNTFDSNRSGLAALYVSSPNSPRPSIHPNVDDTFLARSLNAFVRGYTDSGRDCYC